MKYINEFEIIDGKIYEIEEILGRELTAEENLDILSEFYNKFERLANKLGVKSTDIFKNVQLTAELDELIDYNEELAVRRANEVLRGE